MKHSWQQTIIMIILMSGIFAMFVGLVLVVRYSMHKEFENNALATAEAPSEGSSETASEASSEVSLPASSEPAKEEEEEEVVTPVPEKSTDTLPPSQRQQAAAEEAAKEPSEAPEESDPAVIYEDILSFYQEQLENGWTSPEDASELWYWGETPVSADIAGYEFRDMNGDGTPELLLSIKDESPYDSMIYDFYTCIDGEVRHLFSCEEKSTWYLLENNELLFYTSDSDKTAKLARYKLDETGEFVAQEVLIHDGDTWTDHDEFYTKEVGNDPNYHDKDLPNKMSAVMHDTANAIYDHMTEKRIPLELTMFAA